MPTRFRKVRRRRGFRTHGWGNAGKHRGSGMRGGYGNAGLLKHKWTHTVKFNQDIIGKKGFTCPTSEKKLPIINLTQLDEIGRRIVQKNDQKVLIDLNKLGYKKLLSEGNISHPYQIKINYYSKKAKEKVEAAGGTIVINT